MKSWLSLLIVACLFIQTTAAPRAFGQDDELDKLFEDDGGDDAGAPPFVETPPPPDFDPPPGAGINPPPSNGDSFNNPPPSGSAGNNSRGSIPSSSGISGRSGKSKVGKPEGDVKERFSKAQIEDVTNENFPETIESFDFPNADIKDVINAISELTGKNFIIDTGVQGRVSILAPSKITVAEAYKAFLSALAGLGYTIVPAGKFLKIQNTRTAQRGPIETYAGSYFPDADVLITRIVQLKHTSAEEINKRLRILPSKDGEMTPYEPTNSLILTDFGSNVERIIKIIRELDKPGFEETLEVIPIKYAKAKDLADLLNQIINKEPTAGGGAAGGFRSTTPRFRSRSSPGAPGSGAPEELSLVAPDDRTNAIIVLGTKPGIVKVRGLVKKLDYRLDPSESAGVFVYYVKYGEAEKIRDTLQGVSGGGSSGSGSSSSGFGSGASPGLPSASRPFMAQSPTQGLFGGEVKITADKITNSLVIAANKQDYDAVKRLLSQIDIPRDQVYIEAIIMEMGSQKERSWSPAAYYFKDSGDPVANAAGRIGFSGGDLQGLLNPGGDKGAVLGFGGGGTLTISLGGTEVKIPSLIGFIKFLQTNLESNVLSTPQLLALDNEEATIEVGDQVPVQKSTQTSTGFATQDVTFQDATTKLTLTPYISPDSNTVRMKLKQTIKQLDKYITGEGGAQIPSFTTRGLESNIAVNSGDTAVLGGLIRDQETLNETKVPLLGDIPILGWLFKTSNKTKTKVNLLIFLTPKIIRNVYDSQQNLTKKINQRIDFIKDNFDGRDPHGKKINELPRAEAETEESSQPRKSN